MTPSANNYGQILQTRNILYMPSCLVVEMMTRLYGEVSSLDLSENPHAAVPDLLIMLRRISQNLRLTTDAYRESRIKFFIGDWEDDKKRARKMFFGLMSRLGFISEKLSTAEKRLLLETTDRMGQEWNELDRVIGRRCRESECQRRCSTCRHFRSGNTESWQQVMANTLVSLDDAAGLRDSATILILLCYKRVKVKLLKEIAMLRLRPPHDSGMLADRVQSVSDEDVLITCPKCSLMSSGNASAVIRKEYAPVLQEEPVPVRRRSTTIVEAVRRHVMPETFEEITSGRR